MLRIPWSVWLVVLSVTVSRGTRGEAAAPPALRTGDLVFQTSRSSQSRAIQQATGSRWSHVGIVEVAPDGVFVLEAEGTVARTPWARFLRRGAGDVLALRPRALGPEAAARVAAEARRHLGKPYDPLFGWGDDRFYCSELVRKAFARGASLELGRMERLGDLRLDGLRGDVERRWGNVPAGLELVTPASLAADPRLEEIWRGRAAPLPGRGPGAGRGTVPRT